SNPPPGPWQPVDANYSGLFFQSGGVEFGSSGIFTANTTGKGAYSGKLQIGSTQASFRGQFDPSGGATIDISQKGGGALTLSLQVNTNDNSTISGSISGDSWIANLIANRAAFDKHNNPASFAGTYSLLFPGPGDNDPNH